MVSQKIFIVALLKNDIDYVVVVILDRLWFLFIT